ncbi:hypothetical protein PanWU01x14_219280 [Parasponia andersonii]|uniref:Retrotransposon gag domain-containing protein n=1 Tax=Parasponia andersonii TaxID=3476 RepID=A0A2P5BQM2_PARAD|nr:hypothetical protein PanWU01x14_219280 [Parasponia andersonii]
MAKMRNDITTFAQQDGESLYEAWERYKDMLRWCPHHRLPKWLQLQTFYNGLSGSTRTLVDAAAGGSLMEKTEEAAYELLEEMAANAYQLPIERSTPKKAYGVHEVDALTTLTAQVTALTKRFDAIHPTPERCNLYGGPHASGNCQDSNSFEQPEQAHFVGNVNRQQNNLYSNTYNQGCCNHPNFSWRNNDNAVRPPTGYQP